MRKLVLATAIAATLGTANQAFALGTILFSRNGSGGATDEVYVDTMDWQPDSVLAKNLVNTQIVLGTPVSSLNTNFTLYGQGKMGSLSSSTFANPAVGAAATCSTPTAPSTCAPLSGTEFTFTFGIDLKLTSTGGVAPHTTFTADIDPSGVTNFFNIYFDPTADANALLGTGYTNDTLILSGLMVPSGSDNISFDLNQNASLLRKLDSFGSDQWDGSDSADADASGYARQSTGTYPGLGSLGFQIQVLFQDTSFFITDLTALLIAMDLNGNATTPISNTQPSERVADTTNPNFGTDTKTGTFTSPSSGSTPGTRQMDDFTCLNSGASEGSDVDCDFMVQGDASTSFFNTEEVPEPASLALLGLGLSGLGLTVRRRRRV